MKPQEINWNEWEEIDKNQYDKLFEDVMAVFFNHRPSNDNARYFKKKEVKGEKQMTDLKTLKDLPADYDSYEIDVFKDELKAEAVKWVKEFRKRYSGACVPDILGEAPEGSFIINFFNLTEEDLK